jgi:hypothetical protein
VLAMERLRSGLTAASHRASCARRTWSGGSEDGARGAKVSGDHGGGETPVPIPNTEVKPASADGTWGVAPWESRTSPDRFSRAPCHVRGALFVVRSAVFVCSIQSTGSRGVRHEARTTRARTEA